MNGERIKQERTKHGLSLRTLAALSGVSAATISRIERGKARQASYDNMLKLYDALGIKEEHKGDSLEDVEAKLAQAGNLARRILKLIESEG